MIKIYHRPEKIIPEIKYEIKSCFECPNHEHVSGEGHCDGWERCTALNKEIYNWSCNMVDGFPENCPFKTKN